MSAVAFAPLPCAWKIARIDYTHGIHLSMFYEPSRCNCVWFYSVAVTPEWGIMSKSLASFGGDGKSVLIIKAIMSSILGVL